MSRSKRTAPAAVAPDWPNVPSTDPVVEVARVLANNLEMARAGRTLREIGELAGIDYTVISDILKGRGHPDLFTIARLEAALDVDLWPSGVARKLVVPKASEEA